MTNRGVSADCKVMTCVNHTARVPLGGPPISTSYLFEEQNSIQFSCISALHNLVFSPSDLTEFGVLSSNQK